MEICYSGYRMDRDFSLMALKNNKVDWKVLEFEFRHDREFSMVAMLKKIVPMKDPEFKFSMKENFQWWQ